MYYFRLIGKRPNTYTYTKALAETKFVKDAASLPAAIVRPSIVAAAWKEPIPGWIDNLNGATGLIVGAGKGLIRSILCQREKIADLIPVDVPINLMIAVGWYTAVKRCDTYTILQGYRGNTLKGPETPCIPGFDDVKFDNTFFLSSV